MMRKRTLGDYTSRVRVGSESLLGSIGGGNGQFSEEDSGWSVWPEALKRAPSASPRQSIRILCDQTRSLGLQMTGTNPLH